MRIRGIRGAIDVERNEHEAIIAATERLLGEMLSRNDLDRDDVVSIVFTATEDLDAAFPARAAREVGLPLTPVLSAREITVPGALPRVIRVLMHVYTEREVEEIVHVYLDGAVVLREDL